MGSASTSGRGLSQREREARVARVAAYEGALAQPRGSKWGRELWAEGARARGCAGDMARPL
eukprot:15033370-Alexandrium_andersonii.AAC.1